MRTLIAVMLLTLAGCASVPKTPAPVAPAQVIGVFQCGVFEGALVVMPDGATQGYQPQQAPDIEAAVKAMPHPPYVVQLNDGCVPHQST